MQNFVPIRLILSIYICICPIASVNGQVINEDLKLVANDASSGDRLGHSVDLMNGFVVIGAPEDDDRGSGSGSVYRFHAASGTYMGKTLGFDSDFGDGFGRAVAINNNLFAVGSYFSGSNGLFSGAVYLYHPLTGSFINQIIPFDNAIADNFAISVSLDGALLAAGASSDDGKKSLSEGSVYIYDTISNKLLRHFRPDTEGGTKHVYFYGKTVSMDQGIVAIHGRQHGPGTGAGDPDYDHVYLIEVLTGNLIAKLEPATVLTDDGFGASIAINNGIVAIGASKDSTNGTYAGTVYLFDAATGTLVNQLTPTDAGPSMLFGTSVDISNGVVVVGATGDAVNGFQSGSAYLFDIETGLQIAKLVPSDGHPDSRFGSSVAIENTTVIIGAPEDDNNGFVNNGSAYVFSVPDYTNCQPDINTDGSLDFFDVSAFLSAFSNGNFNIADFNSDENLDFFDVSVFLQLFSKGCS